MEPKLDIFGIPQFICPPWYAIHVEHEHEQVFVEFLVQFVQPFLLDSIDDHLTQALADCEDYAFWRGWAAGP